MAFPAAVQSNESTGTASSTPFAATTTCFQSAARGELLVMWFWMPGAGNVAGVPPNENVEWFGAGGLNQNPGVQCFTKFADGTEGSTTGITTHNGASKTITVRAERYGTSAHKRTRPVGTQAAGFDPASLNPTAWDTEDTTWFAAVCATGGAGSPPEGWTTVTTPGGTMQLIKKEQNVASQDPGAWTGTTGDGVVITVAMRPRQIYVPPVMLM